MPRATTQETLVMLTDQVEALVQIHNIDVEQKADESRMWPKAKGWIGKNVIWVLGILAAVFWGWVEVRDGYRDHLKGAADFQVKSDARHTTDTKSLTDHIVKAEEEQKAQRKAIVETQVTAVEVLDQLQKEMRIVHPRLIKKSPKESPTLSKARDAAAKAKAEDDIFKDEK
jgi:hypothetical protein